MPSKPYSLTGVLHVLIPNRLYNGQTLKIEVSKNTPDTTNKTIPSTPLITLVKNNTIKTAAITIRKLRSSIPMFFFIIEIF